MEKKEIIWTLPAKTDLQNIFDFLSEVSYIVALRIIQKILARTRLLEYGFSKMGQAEPLLKNRKKGFRYLIEGNYKIIYNEQYNKIIIHAVFDSRQNPRKLKKL